ncbi:MAG: hypothetical protein IJX92_07555 [Clostridia bacterium]|nr:hypothetical protein [Clostridia bacterium]
MNTKLISGNQLKVLAAVFMVVDHIGLMFFPTMIIFRCIGRLSMPIFAFMISEGARYTKNKVRYFLSVFILAAICQTVYFFADGGSLYMSILVTFSISIILIYMLNNFKKSLLSKSATATQKAVSGAVLISGVTLTYILNKALAIDYGFIGCIMPAIVSIFDFKDMDAPKWLARLDCIPLRVLCLGVAIVIMAIIKGATFVWCALLAVPLLLLYSEKRGKWKMKYFFYLFYPLHLVALEGIYILTKII